MGFRVFGIVFGAFFSLLAGAVTARIGFAAPVRHALDLAGLIAVASLISLAVRPGDGAVWTQVSSLVLFAPAAVLGGYLLGKHSESRNPGRAQQSP